jgi:tetratricopeptide (TPR) repeat protein
MTAKIKKSTDQDDSRSGKEDVGASGRHVGPRHATEDESAFGPLRRSFYRNERRLVVAWLAVLVVLNAMPLFWELLDEHYGIEATLIEERETRWASPLRAASKLARKGKTTAAIELFERTLEGMPALTIPERTGRTQLEAMTTLATLYVETGEAKRAVRLAKHVTKIDPLDYRAHTALGNALWSLGKTDDALDAFEISLGYVPYQIEPIKKILEVALEKARYIEVIDRAEQYLDAPYPTKAALYFSQRYEDLDRSKQAIEFPVLLDGKPHTYRVFVNSDRLKGMNQFVAMPDIAGLRLVPALVDHVITEIDSLSFYGGDASQTPSGDNAMRDRKLSPSITRLFHTEEFDHWTPIGHLERLEGGRMHSPRALASIKSQVQIVEPASVAYFEIRMTLQRPVDSDFLAMMQTAYRNTLQAEKGFQLAKRLVPFDAPGENTARNLVASDTTQATVRKKSQ